jgi:hypothetical protein
MTRHPFAHLIGGGITRAAVSKKAKAAPKARDFSHLNASARPAPPAADTRPAGQQPAATPEQTEAKRLAAQIIANGERCVR